MITTSGHRLSVMPRYTPMDPSIMALDIGAFFRGANQTLQTADAARRVIQGMQTMKSDVERAKALNALEAKRAGAGMRTVDPETDLMLRRIFAQGKLVDPSTENELTRLALEKELLPKRGAEEAARLAAAAPTYAPKAEADIAAAKAATANSNIELSTAPDRSKVAQTQASRAAGRVDMVEDVNDMTTGVSGRAARDAFLNFDTDAAMRRQKEMAQIAALGAQADQARAHGEYFRAGGRQMNPRDPVTRLGALTRVIDSESKRMYNIPGQGNGTLSDYIAHTYERWDPDPSKRVINDPFFGSPRQINPQAEAAIAKLIQLGELEKGLLNQVAMGLPDQQVGGLLSGISGPAQPQMPPVQEEAPAPVQPAPVKRYKYVNGSIQPVE